MHDRSSADDLSGVDFVVGPGADAEPVEEELATGPARPPNRVRTYAVVAVVIAAFAVVGILRLIGSQPVPRTHIPPHPVAVPVIGGPRRPVADLPSSAVDVGATDPKACPEAGDGSPVCAASRRLPVGVVAAVLAHFPRTRTVRGLDEEVRDTGAGPGGLWYREVYARVGHVRLTITVTHTPVETPEEAAKLPSLVTFSYAKHGLYVHTVAHVGAGGVSVPKLMALTSDRRLRAPAG